MNQFEPCDARLAKDGRVLRCWYRPCPIG